MGAHSAQTPTRGIHGAIAYVAADEAARLALGPFVAADQFKLCFQEDAQAVYMLTNTAGPTWLLQSVEPGFGEGAINGSAIEFNGALRSSHKYTVVGAGSYEIQLLDPVDGAAYNIVIINTAGATLTLNAKFLTFPDAQVPAAAAGSRTLISTLYDATLDVFHTSLATR